MSKIKQRLILLVLFVFLFISSSSNVSANFMENIGVKGGTGSTTTGNPANIDTSRLRFSQSVNSEEQNITSWTGYPLVANLYHLTSLIVGYPDENGQINSNNSAVSSLDKALTFIYSQKPVSSSLYLANLKDNILLSKPAYAQAIGADFFPVKIFDMWRAIRDVAYSFMVIVMVAIGFMVMFRFKIDPQTAVNVQSALPKIIVSLILIFFSYAIIGIIIDLAFWGNAFIEYVVVNTLAIGTVPKTSVFFLITGGFGSFNIFGRIATGLFNLAIGNLGAVLELVIAFALLTSAVKIFFALLTRYVNILLGAIFIPLTILWGTIPGQYDTFPKFFKSMISSALSFPATILFLSLASFFATAPAGGGSPNLPFIPPLEDLGGTVTLAGAGTASAFNLLIAMGILMATANIPQIIDDALSVKPSTIGAGVSESAGFLRRIPIVGSFLG